jgi:hypothetical protein
MVKASELMIGNLLKSNLTDSYFKCTAEDILNIEKDNSVCDTIALTPEILDKCGFKKDYSGLVLPDKMSLSFSVTKEFGYLACWQDKCLHLPYNIKYLHQLQNLYYSLTGEELEAKF